VHTEGEKIAAGQSVPDIRWLALGAIAGLIMAGYGFLRQAEVGGDLPDSAVARVNDALISRDNYARVLARYATEAREPAAAETRGWLLERLIDEELLVPTQRAQAMRNSSNTWPITQIDSVLLPKSLLKGGKQMTRQSRKNLFRGCVTMANPSSLTQLARFQTFLQRLCRSRYCATILVLVSLLPLQKCLLAAARYLRDADDGS